MTTRVLSVRVEVEVDLEPRSDVTDPAQLERLIRGSLARAAEQAIAADERVVRVIHAATVLRQGDH